MLTYLLFVSLVTFAGLVAAALAERNQRRITSGLSRADELALQRRFPLHGGR